MKTIALFLSGLVAIGCSGRSYQGTGMVLSVEQQRQIIVSHDRIPGLMGPMIMRFKVADSERLERFVPGDRIRFRLRARSQIDHITRLASTRSGILGQTADRIDIGQAVSSFSLVDQHGKELQLAELRGKVAVVNFIYTRCPLAEYCARLTTHFAALQQHFADRLQKRLVLLTVTFDPQHDGPEILGEYAEQWRARAGWYFLSGDPETVSQLCRQLGVEYWPEYGLLTHTMTTAVIGPEGTLLASIDGSDYSSEQLIDLVEKALEATL